MIRNSNQLRDSYGVWCVPCPPKHTIFNEGAKVNEYEEQLLASGNPHWMLSYIKSTHTAFVKMFIAAIQDSNSLTARHGLERFLKANERLR